MQVVLVYGTTDGHTPKIAGFVADRLGRQGHQLVVAPDARPRACIRAIIQPWRDFLPLGRPLWSCCCSSW
jgi:hypothetical protein